MAEIAYNKIVALTAAEARDRNRGLLDFEIILAHRGPQAVKSIVDKFSKSQDLSEFAIGKGWPPAEILDDVLGNADAVFVPAPPLPPGVKDPAQEVLPIPDSQLTITIMSYVPREKQSVFHQFLESGMDAGSALLHTIDRQEATEILRQTIWTKYPTKAKQEGIIPLEVLEGSANKEAILEDMKQDRAATDLDRNLVSAAKAWLSSTEFATWKSLFDNGTPADEAMISTLSGQYERTMKGVAYLQKNVASAPLMTPGEVAMRLQELGIEPTVQKPPQIVNLNAPGVTDSELTRKALAEKIKNLNPEAQIDLARLDAQDAGEGAELLRDNIEKTSEEVDNLAKIEQTLGKQAREFAQKGAQQTGVPPNTFLIGAAALLLVVILA